MPFGAEIQPDGAVRFRLWAPDAHDVRLRVEDSAGERWLPMERTEGGWYEQQSVDAGPGTLYRYQIDGRMEVPDPASRFQPQDVHGPSEIIDPTAFRWQDARWQGRPWASERIW